MQKVQAIVLLSGGIDSCVILALVRQKKASAECLALSFDYGQRHRIELESAKRIADHYGVIHRVVRLDPESFQSSALVGSGRAIPQGRDAKTIAESGIPSTYVPARNSLFLAYAMCQAEIYSAEEIHFGPNALDQRPYPDCRPAYIQAFQGLLDCATKQAVEGSPPKLMTPLIEMNKREIVKLGLALQAPLELTLSCYNPGACGSPCKGCDACHLREEALMANEHLITRKRR